MQPWISHLLAELELGLWWASMNARELEANSRLTEFVQVDLNVAPSLPFDDASFDAVLNVVSVDYLSSRRRSSCAPSAASGWLCDHDFSTAASRPRPSRSGLRRATRACARLWPPTGCSPPGAGRHRRARYRAASPMDALTDPLSWLEYVGDPMFVVRVTKA